MQVVLVVPQVVLAFVLVVLLLLVEAKMGVNLVIQMGQVLAVAMMLLQVGVWALVVLVLGVLVK